MQYTCSAWLIQSQYDPWVGMGKEGTSYQSVMYQKMHQDTR